MSGDQYTRALFEATEAARAAGVTFKTQTVIKPEPHRELTIWMPLAEDWQRVLMRLLGAIRDAYTDDDSELVVAVAKEQGHGERRSGKGKRRPEARADGGGEARG